jgi:hypothetical protein
MVSSIWIATTMVAISLLSASQASADMQYRFSGYEVVKSTTQDKLKSVLSSITGSKEPPQRVDSTREIFIAFSSPNYFTIGFKNLGKAPTRSNPLAASMGLTLTFYTKDGTSYETDINYSEQDMGDKPLDDILFTTAVFPDHNDIINPGDQRTCNYFITDPSIIGLVRARSIERILVQDKSLLLHKYELHDGSI